MTYIPVYGHKERVSFHLFYTVHAGTCREQNRERVRTEPAQWLSLKVLGLGSGGTWRADPHTPFLWAAGPNLCTSQPKGFELRAPGGKEWEDELAGHRGPPDGPGRCGRPGPKGQSGWSGLTACSGLAWFPLWWLGGITEHRPPYPRPHQPGQGPESGLVCLWVCMMWAKALEQAWCFPLSTWRGFLAFTPVQAAGLGPGLHPRQHRAVLGFAPATLAVDDGSYSRALVCFAHFTPCDQQMCGTSYSHTSTGCTNQINKLNSKILGS